MLSKILFLLFQTCPITSLSISISAPTSTGVVVTNLTCIPMDPNVFVMMNGQLLIQLQPIVGPQFTQIAVAGPYDSNRILWSLSVSPPAGTIVLKNSVILKNTVDYAFVGTFLIFTKASAPAVGDQLAVYFLTPLPE